MNSTTLRGIFPDPKPVHRRNFVRENMRHVKQMEGLIQQELNFKSPSQLSKTSSKYKDVPPRVYSNITNWKRRSKLELHRPSSHNNPRILKTLLIKSKTDCERRFVHRGVQTEREEVPTPRSPLRATTEYGDTSKDLKVDNLTKNMQKVVIDERKPNFVKENIKNLKGKPKVGDPPNPTLPPADYQKGVLPKYLQERKYVKCGEVQNECYPGLVMLPDEERREYLRVARENYAGLIKELNTMPVRNDTLKRRNRKMEIENELKRLDEVIKIFQKPKVFVKADT